MGLVVLVGENSVTTAATNNGTHCVEHIDHAHSDDDHNYGEYAASFRNKTFLEYVNKGKEYRVFTCKEVCEVFPKLPGNRAVTCENRKIGNAKGNADQCGTYNANDNGTFYLQFIQNGNQEQTNQSNDSGFGSLKDNGIIGRAVIYQLHTPVRKVYQTNLSKVILNNNTRILEADVSNKETDTNRNRASDCYGHTVEYKLTEGLAVDFDKSKSQEQNAGDENHHKRLTESKSNTIGVSRPKSNETAKQGVKSHTGSLRQRHFGEERHQECANNSTECGCDEYRGPISLVCTNKDLRGVDCQNVRHCKKRNDTCNDFGFDTCLLCYRIKTECLEKTVFHFLSSFFYILIFRICDNFIII